MLRLLHHLSGFFFYLLGTSFFVAWVLIRNLLWIRESATWMQIADLPLAFSALVYGGLSLYLSLLRDGKPPRGLEWMIAVPLGVIFVAILVMNFWTM